MVLAVGLPDWSSEHTGNKQACTSRTKHAAHGAERGRHGRSRVMMLHHQSGSLWCLCHLPFERNRSWQSPQCQPGQRRRPANPSASAALPAAQGRYRLQTTLLPPTAHEPLVLGNSCVAQGGGAMHAGGPRGVPAAAGAGAMGGRSRGGAAGARADAIVMRCHRSHTCALA